MKEIKIGMKVYCDLHHQSKEHVVTGLRAGSGFAVIDNKFYWPISQCFPCETTKLPEYDEATHHIFG